MWKELSFNTAWIKENWWLITAASTLYIYIIGFSSTLIFFKEFDVAVFSFFNITDYLRILLRDLELFAYPFMIIILVLALSITRNYEKRLANQQGDKDSTSLFIKTVIVFVVVISLIFPILHAQLSASRIK
mgnify:FL=1